MENSNVIKALLIGAGIGAVTGILLAPKSGKETRNDISNFAHDNFEKGKDILSSTADQLHSIAKQIGNVEIMEKLEKMMPDQLKKLV